MLHISRTIRTPAVLAIAVLGLAAGAAGRADAGVIVSNLGLQPEFLTDGSRVAQSFTAGGTNQVLGSVTLRLQSKGADDQPGIVALQLFSDASGMPGSSLLDLGTITLGSDTDFKDYTVIAPQQYTLLANTTYWIEAEVSAGLVEWAGPTSTITTGPGTLAAFALGSDAEEGGWSVDGDSRLQLAVNSPVANPEPSSLALVGIGATGLLGYAWRRRLARA
jgi:hypothetical protein